MKKIGIMNENFLNNRNYKKIQSQKKLFQNGQKEAEIKKKEG